MKLVSLIEGYQRKAECKNCNPVTSIYGVTFQFNFCNKKHISESIKRNKMKFDTLIDDYQRKCRMQEQ